jgi:ribosome recycling factor
MIEDLKKDGKQRMEKSVAALTATFTKIRTGRAHPSLLEQVSVEYYGADTPLNRVANITVDDARTLAVTPFEQALVPAIEKAIMAANLGLNPMSAGSVIRVPLPDLTEERRRDLAKVVRNEAEQSKVAIRNIRRDILTDVKELLKEKDISEDDERRAQQDVQQLTDTYIAKVDELSEAKQAEVMAI